MGKIKELIYKDEETGEVWHHQFIYWCAGCGYEHAFALRSEGGHHEFNGDLNVPTVSPSLLENRVPGKLCHSFIKAGVIQYLNDCHHHLRGMIMQLPDIDFELNKRKNDGPDQNTK